MDELFNVANLHNNILKEYSCVTSNINQIKELSSISPATGAIKEMSSILSATNKISNFSSISSVSDEILKLSSVKLFTPSAVASIATEIQTVLSATKFQASPFENISSFIKNPSINAIITSCQDMVGNLKIKSNADTDVTKRFSDLLDKTVDEISLDEESQSLFKDTSEKVKSKNITIEQIIQFILSIITILTFVQSCSPNKQLSENNELQRQEVQELQNNNDLLVKQNEQLETIIKMCDEYTELLLEIDKSSAQDVDTVD